MIWTLPNQQPAWRSKILSLNKMRANGLLFNARSVNNVHNLRVCRNSLQTRATVPSSVQTDVYDELATHAELLQTPRVVNVRTTPLGRGLVAAADVARGPIASVPIYNALVLCDDPLGGISVFSDRQQREWQERHGEMPPELADFIQGPAGSLDLLLGRIKGGPPASDGRRTPTCAELVYCASCPSPQPDQQLHATGPHHHRGAPGPTRPVIVESCPCSHCPGPP
jgi:hypothetical protein